MSADEQGYNGWHNYETWAMALWIDNDQSSYEEARMLRTEAIEEHDELTVFAGTIAGALARRLQDWQEGCRYEWLPDHASVFTDLSSAAFGRINWYEIAENYLSELEG